MKLTNNDESKLLNAPFVFFSQYVKERKVGISNSVLRALDIATFLVQINN